MIDFHRRVLIAVCAATCMGAASTRAPPWPEGFSIVIIEGTRTYKILNAGPMFGKDKKPLGIGILYAASSTDWTSLKTAAADLFAYVLPRVEEHHADGVAILAQPGWNADGKSVTFGIIYKLQQDGWHLTSPDDTKALPSVSRTIDSEARPDRDADAKARAAAESWLALLDAGNVDRAWETSAPMMKAISPKAKWTGLLRRIDDETGKLAARSLFAMTEAAQLPNTAYGKYVIAQFRSHFARQRVAAEEVVAVLCDDGEWRVGGYTVFTGEPFTAKLVVTPRVRR